MGAGRRRDGGVVPDDAAERQDRAQAGDHLRRAFSEHDIEGEAVWLYLARAD